MKQYRIACKHPNTGKKLFTSWGTDKKAVETSVEIANKFRPEIKHYIEERDEET